MNKIKIIDGIRWYPFLVEKEGRPAHLTLFSQKVTNVRQLYIRMTSNGYKRFATFKSPISLYNYILNTPLDERCFDEIVSDSYQKVRFDIDIELKSEQREQSERNEKSDKRERSEQSKKKVLDELIQNVTDSLITSLFNIIPDLKPEKIMYFSSHGESKRSVHLVFPKYHTSCCDEAKELYRLVTKFIPHKYSQYIDHGIYGNNKSLRIMNCCKWGSDRVKKLNESFILSGNLIKYEGEKPDTNSLRFLSSLISLITDSECLPNLLAKPKNRIKSEMLPGGLVSTCIERARSVLKENYTFEYDGVEGSVIILKRISPSYCKLCNRVHDVQNPYLLLYQQELFFHCRRFEGKTRGLSLGNINDADVYIEENTEVGVKIMNSVDGSKIIKTRGSTFVLGKKDNKIIDIETIDEDDYVEQKTSTVEPVKNTSGVPRTTTKVLQAVTGVPQMTTPGVTLSSSTRISEMLRYNSSKTRSVPRREKEEKKKIQNIINIEKIIW